MDKPFGLPSFEKDTDFLEQLACNSIDLLEEKEGLNNKR